MGSIPALAGERVSPQRRGGTGRVYPRACGGMRQQYHAMVLAQGLSPRLRGNAGILFLDYLCRRSIPALAGERGKKPQN